MFKKIGFYIKWNKYSINSFGNVIGDELWGESLCKVINSLFPQFHAELYAPNYLPPEKLDVMIYLNDNEPVYAFADRHILYIQNGYGDEAERIIERLTKKDYSGYIFFSKKMQTIYETRYKTADSLYLPFGVDLETFYPRTWDNKYAHDVAYVGNDIKGTERTMLYLYPAVSYDFGLYGNWKIPRARFRFWKNWETLPHYKKAFESVSKGKIPQEHIPILYSSAKINLNCTLQSCVDWDVVTLRTYEVLACKGFLISDIVLQAKEELQDCVVFTRGGDELKEQIKYYLAHPREREKIASRGYEYARKSTSVFERAKTLIGYIKEVVR